MISKIEFIKDFGILKDISNTGQIQGFEKYNLIYGWNGSGKSTFSKLFNCLKSKTLNDSFKKGAFSFRTDDGIVLNSKSIDNIPEGLKIEVFNEHFVDENIDWDNITKKLLYISKKKVEDKKNLDNLTDEFNSLEVEINKKENEIEKTANELDTFLINGAKEIKNEFKILSTEDKYYLNYDKRRLKKLIDDNISEIKKTKLIAKTKEIDSLKLTARLEYLDKIDALIPEKIDYDSIRELQTEANLLIKKNIVADTISSLQKNTQVSMWVEEGLKFHNNSKRCKFCKNPISESRLSELNAHFNEDFRSLQMDLEVVIRKFETFKSEILTDFLLDVELYPFLRKEYLKFLSEFRSLKVSIENSLNKSIDTLNLKYKNPFNYEIGVIEIAHEEINKFNATIDGIVDIVKRHNETSDDFENFVDKAKKKLELSIAQKEVKKSKYFSKIRLNKANERQLEKLSEKKPVLTKKIRVLNASLNDEILGAEEFNNKLHRFLNHSDISLRFNSSKNGYEIIRRVGKKSEKGSNLSEGEKTAISFVYFLTKLLEKEGELKETIIVIDDPISSFDSNHLFNAYSFINNICNDSKQLFVLTHNFTFYRLVRDWMMKKTKKKKDSTGKVFFQRKYSIYNIISDYRNGVRQSSIENADNTLLLYSTEYHYLFMKLNTFLNQSKLSVEQCFSVANISRKLLEIFLNFKFPKKRNDFAQLLNNALPSKSDDIMRERVYRFINKYSHSDHIEAFDNSIDNILSESDNIVKDVMKIIKKLDRKHFDELVEIVGE
ncbi:AAA family ATPase [Flagellimonas profundi]|uniref:AAA family ATPase n=1 Tax=Flagellimonas profundi TaxID=2915620 RepID=A0ABS3FCZ0_9FLAO|nr:AAA family ATPase [Allomuricauda profundi]MBO0341013.1 AAA family ATPase [Allomuricauda profundi]